MVVRSDPGDGAIPYVTYSSFQIGGSLVFEIHTSRWTGSDWILEKPFVGLIDPPFAVTAWKEVPSPGNDDLVYAFFDQGQLFWQAWDTVQGQLLGFAASMGTASGDRASLAVTAQGDPAFTWKGQPTGQAQGVWYVRWDVDLGVPVDQTPLPQCDGDWTSLLLDGNDIPHIVCRDSIAAGEADVEYIVRQQNGALVPETVFGAADDHLWLRPAATWFDGQPVVVAFDNDTAQTVLRRRDAVNGWGPPILLASGILPQNLDVTAVDDGNGNGTIAVTILSAAEAWYTEIGIQGGQNTFTPLRRMDLNPDTGGAACETHGQSVRIHLEGDRAVSSWIALSGGQVAPRQQVHIARFTQFRRADTTTWNLPLTRNLPRAASFALDDAGSGWTCFYDEDPGGSPQSALFIRFRDEVPLLVDDTGLPADAFARGCDVAVAPDGTIGVAWGDQASGQLRYRENVAGAFGLINVLIDGLGVVPAADHVALAFDANSEPHIVFRRQTNQLNPWHAHRAAGAWQTQMIDALPGGSWPDVAFAAGSNDPIASYALTALGGTVTLARALAGGGWVFQDLRTNTIGFDTSLAVEDVAGQEIVGVGWLNAILGQIEGGRAIGGALVGAVELLDGSAEAGEFVGMEIDPVGELVATQSTRTGGATDMLRLSYVRPFSGGRQLGLNPQEEAQPARLHCDLRPSDWGTAIDLDVHGNPRVIHRRNLSTPAQHDLNFVTRP